MAHALLAASLSLLLLAGMLATFIAGKRLGRRWRDGDPKADDTTGTMDTAVFAVFGLLIAFTFSGAMSRFDWRRALVVQEANAIGTAWLRVDLLPPAAQAEVRPLFRAYVESRLEAYRAVPDQAKVKAALDRGNDLQGRIWKASVTAARTDGNAAVISLVSQSLNDMIDITTTRAAAIMTHPPPVIFALLFALGLASALVSGLAMGRGSTRTWVHALVFAATIAASVYVIIDMEYPRLGLIRVDEFDRLLEDVLAGMR